MNTNSTFDNAYQTLESNLNLLNKCNHLTDLEIQTVNQHSLLVSRWYAKIPLIGHVISWIRFKLYGQSLASQQIKKMVQLQCEQIEPEFLRLLRLETESLTTTEKVHSYCKTVDLFLNKIDSKNPTKKLNENRFAKLLNLSIDLDKIEKDLFNGHLPSKLVMSKIELLKTLISSHDVFIENNLENEVDSKLNKISQLVENYNLLLNVEKKLSTTQYDFLNSKYDRLVALINLTETINQEYKHAIANQLIYQNSHINNICNALNEIKQIDTFKKYYSAFLQSIETFDLYSHQIRIWTKYEFNIIANNILFTINQSEVDFKEFFENLVAEDIEYAMSIIKEMNEKFPLFNEIILILWQKCSRLAVENEEKLLSIFSKSEEKKVFLNHFKQLFYFYINFTSLIDNIENELSQGDLPSESEINEIKSLAKIINKDNLLNFENEKFFCLVDLNKINELVEKYEYLLLLKKELKNFGFLEDCELVDLIKLTTKIEQKYQNKDLEALISYKNDIKKLDLWIKFISRDLLFEYYYPKFHQLLKIFDSHLDKINVLIKYQYNIGISLFTIDQIKVDFQIFF